jgi:hypothetical protein
MQSDSNIQELVKLTYEAGAPGGEVLLGLIEVSVRLVSREPPVMCVGEPPQDTGPWISAVHDSYDKTQALGSA